MRATLFLGVLGLLVTVAGGCAGGARVMVGVTSRAAIEGELPNWRDEIARASVDEDVARSLRDVPPGAEVDVFLGTWCGDSRRVVARHLPAREVAGEPQPVAPFLHCVKRPVLPNARFTPTG